MSNRFLVLSILILYGFNIGNVVQRVVAQELGNSRTWTNSRTGESGAAQFVKIQKNVVVLKNSAGLLVQVRLEDLSDDDLNYLNKIGQYKPPKKNSVGSNEKLEQSVGLLEPIEFARSPFVAVYRRTKNHARVEVGFKFPMDGSVDQIVIPSMGRMNSVKELSIQTEIYKSEPGKKFVGKRQTLAMADGQTALVLRGDSGNAYFPDLFPKSKIAEGQKLKIIFAVPRNGAEPHISLLSATVSVKSLIKGKNGTTQRFVVNAEAPTDNAVGWIVDPKSGKSVGIVPPSSFHNRNRQSGPNALAYPLTEYFEFRAPIIQHASAWWEQIDDHMVAKLYFIVDRQFPPDTHVQLGHSHRGISGESVSLTKLMGKSENDRLEQKLTIVDKPHLQRDLINHEVDQHKYVYLAEFTWKVKDKSPGDASTISEDLIITFSGTVVSKDKEKGFDNLQGWFFARHVKHAIPDLFETTEVLANAKQPFAKEIPITSALTTVRPLSKSEPPKYGKPVPIKESFPVNQVESTYLLQSKKGFWPEKPFWMTVSGDEKSCWLIDQSSILRKIELPSLKFSAKVFLHQFGATKSSINKPYYLGVCSEGVIAGCDRGFWVIDSNNLKPKRWVEFPGLKRIVGCQKSPYVFAVKHNFLYMFDVVKGQPIQRFNIYLATKGKTMPGIPGAKMNHNRKRLHHFCISSDGKYLYGLGGAIFKFQIKNEELVFEKRSPMFWDDLSYAGLRLVENDQTLLVSAQLNPKFANETSGKNDISFNRYRPFTCAVSTNELARIRNNYGECQAKPEIRGKSDLELYLESAILESTIDFGARIDRRHMFLLPNSNFVLTSATCSHPQRFDRGRLTTYNAPALALVDFAPDIKRTEMPVPESKLAQLEESAVIKRWKKVFVQVEELKLFDNLKDELKNYENRKLPTGGVPRNQPAFLMRNIAWNRKGDVYFVGSRSGTVQRVDRKGHLVTAKLTINDSIDSMVMTELGPVCFSNTGKKIYLLNRRTLEIIKSFSCPDTRHICASNRLKYLVLENRDRTLSVFNLESWQVEHSISIKDSRKLVDGSTISRFDEDSEVILTGANGIFLRYNRLERRTELVLGKHPTPQVTENCLVIEAAEKKGFQVVSDVGSNYKEKNAMKITSTLPIGFEPKSKTLIGVDGGRAVVINHKTGENTLEVDLIKNQGNQAQNVLYSFASSRGDGFLLVYPDQERAFFVSFFDPTDD